MGISGRKKEFSPFFRFHIGVNEVESVTIAIDLNNENKGPDDFRYSSQSIAGRKINQILLIL